MTSNKDEMLEIVDENDLVIGLEPKSKVHKEGLLHREIHIWFITREGEIIFQHRAPDKDSYPNRLDATVGGHCEPGSTYEETAIKECKEETGMDVDMGDILLLTKMRKESYDEKTDSRNSTFRCQFAYLYEGRVEDLQVEAGKAQGFELWKIDDLSSLSPADRERFIPLILEKDMLDLFDQAKTILLN